MKIIDAFGDFLCWIPDAAARLKQRSPIEDDGSEFKRGDIYHAGVVCVVDTQLPLRAIRDASFEQ